MEKEELLKVLKSISDVYFNKKDYISAGQINRAMDVIVDFDGEIFQEDNRLLAENCEHRQHDQAN